MYKILRIDYQRGREMMMESGINGQMPDVQIYWILAVGWCDRKWCPLPPPPPSKERREISSLTHSHMLET